MYERPETASVPHAHEDGDLPAAVPGDAAAEPRPSDLVKDELPAVPGVDQPGGADEQGARTTPVPSVEDITEAMRDVVDPELMVNVVDLGLLYGVTVDDDANVALDMTLTSPTCPLTDRIEYDTQTVLEGLVNSVAINWVWLPPWSLDMITDDGREQLRAVGYNV